jgi:hypothetical protein
LKRRKILFSKKSKMMHLEIKILYKEQEIKEIIFIKLINLIKDMNNINNKIMDKTLIIILEG